MKKCAVIVAAFNASKYVKKCLDSIKAQRVLDGWQYEIRLGVDGCHNTARALQLSKRSFYYSSRNVGTYVMANSLIALGPADVYARFDADDFMLPYYLETVIPVALDYGVCHAPHIVGKRKVSKPRVGQVTFTQDTLDQLGGFHFGRVHSDRDFSRRCMMIGLDIKGMRHDERLQRGLFVRRPVANSLTRSASYGNRSVYRKQIKESMSKDRKKGIVKIEPRTIELCHKIRL